MKIEPSNHCRTPFFPGRFRRKLRLLSGETGGQSAIEFVLLLPLMALLIAGTVDLGQGLMIGRKINQIAAMTSDIISQEDAWTSSATQSVLAGSAVNLVPFDSTELKIIVSVVDFGEDGVARVSSSKAYQTTPMAPGSIWPHEISQQLIESGVQLVATKAEYDSSSVITELLSSITGIDFHHFSGLALARPRVGDSVQLR